MAYPSISNMLPDVPITPRNKFAKYAPDYIAAAQAEKQRRIDAGTWQSGNANSGAVLNIAGKRVRVDDSFRTMPHDAQNQAVDEIASQIFEIQGNDGQNYEGKGTSPEQLRVTNKFAKYAQQPNADSANIIEVELPDGSIAEFPAGTSNEVMKSALAKRYPPTQEPQPQWGDLPGNVMPSMGNAAMGFYQAIRHPIETSNAIDQMIGGGIANVNDKIYGMLPHAVSGPLRSFDNAVAPWTPFASVQMQADPAKRENAQQIAGAVGGMMKDRYGGLDNIKRTMIQDPFGAALDASAIFSGGGTLAAKVPALGNIAKAMTTTGKLLDPIANTGRLLRKTGEGVGSLASYPLSLATGATPDAIRMGYQSGKAGGEAGNAFRRNMRGHESPDAVVNEARGALDNMADTRNADYLKNMAATSASGAAVDFAPIRARLNDLRQSMQVAPGPGGNTAAFGPLSKASAGEAKLLDDMEALVNAWEQHPQGTLPIAVDALRQRISKLGPDFTNPNAANERRLVAGMNDALASAINTVEPSYAKALSEYSTSKNATTEITKALGIGKGASVDTAAAKLKTALGGRATRANALADLEANGAKNLSQRLAGQQMADIMPKGLLGKITSAAVGYSGYLNPTTLAALPLTSPRFVGELAHLLGRGVRHTAKAGTKGDRTLIAALLAGRARQNGEEVQQSASQKAVAKALQAKRINTWKDSIR